MRLQPSGSRADLRARSAGSATCARMVPARPTRSTQAHQPRALDEAEDEHLAPGVDAGADAPSAARARGGTARARGRGSGGSCAASPTAAVRWKTCSRADLRLDRRDELDRRGARADHGHALGRGGRGRGPSGRSGRPCRRTCPGRERRGCFGSFSGPWPAIRTRALHRPGGRREHPAAGRLVPRGGLDRGAAAGSSASRSWLSAQRAAGRRGSRAGGVRVRPLRVGRERERVQVRRDVAGAAGIRVRPPRAADSSWRSSTTKSSQPLAGAGGSPCRGRRTRRR